MADSDTDADAKPYVAPDVTAEKPSKGERISPLEKYDEMLTILNDYIDQPGSLIVHEASLTPKRDPSKHVLPTRLHKSLTSIRNVLYKTEFMNSLGFTREDLHPRRQLLMEVMLMQNWFNGLPGIFPTTRGLTLETLTKSIRDVRQSYDKTHVIVVHTSTDCDACSRTIAVVEEGCVAPCPHRHFLHLDCARPSLEPAVGQYRQCPVCHTKLAVMEHTVPAQQGSFAMAPLWDPAQTTNTY